MNPDNMRRRQYIAYLEQVQGQKLEPGMAQCPQCGKVVKERGLHAHKRFCKGVQ